MDDSNDQYAFSDSDSSPVLNPATEALLNRSTELLEEVESFQRSLRRKNLEKTVELRLFLNQVKSEYRCIQSARYGVYASNLPYLEALWAHAKTTTGITALCKSFSYTQPMAAAAANANSNAKAKRKKDKASVTVDIVAQNGLQWIKLSLLTPRRLLFELAKAGWEGDSDPEGDDDGGDDENDDDGPALTLATSSTTLSILADTLLLAASQTRIQYLHPTITFILPHLTPSTPEIQAFLSTLHNKGITIHTPSTTLSPPISALISTLSSPLSRRAIPLTPSLNLDTTILLALASDVSHRTSVPHEPHFHPALLHQLSLETHSRMLESHLYPILAGRPLTASAAARARFDEIVEIVASDDERARAHALFNPAPGKGKETFAALSAYECPLVLPVVEVPNEIPKRDECQKVAAKLSAANRGAFMTGWARGVTTVTSNRSVAKMVEVACSIAGEEVVGPDVFVVETGRSLVGKTRRIEVE